MTAHEVRFRPLMRFEAAREAGGGSTTIYGADLGEARVFVANNEYIRSGRTGYDHAGTLITARREQNTEIIHTNIPEKGDRDRLARERAMALLTFAMLAEDPNSGNWQGDERLFVDPNNAVAVDPDFLAVLGIHKRHIRRLSDGDVQSDVVHIEQPVERVAGRTQSALRRTQAYKTLLPEDSVEASIWIEQERNAA
jgi:hypothetical protein